MLNKYKKHNECARAHNGGLAVHLSLHPHSNLPYRHVVFLQ